MICMGAFFAVTLSVVTEIWTFPLQNASMVRRAEARVKREPSVFLDPEDISVMDKIISANRRIGVAGLSIRDADIATSNPRSALICPANSCLWPKSVDGFVYVPYMISQFYDDMDRITIETGMLDIMSQTCVKFIPRTHQANFLNIQPKRGCWSFLGMIGGPQTVSLQTPACMWSGVATHELMHALSFVHEHSRSDRDSYVTIRWENIMRGQVHNFQKHKTRNSLAYDYSSIMHYGRYAFSEEGEPTIIPKPDPTIPIGQRNGPSVSDIHKINVLYDCGG
ncbi:hypothetical protein ACEWY4_023246 [Coilia grayii]|uniref:Metalloendopeptidase n=1 Tax=Coilia grayii TaxID=363190 RepID=A0ABD1J5Y6_9TELE